MAQYLRDFEITCSHSKGKAIPAQAWTGPLGCMRLRFVKFLDSRHMKVVRLSVLRFGPLYPPGDRFMLEAESTLSIVWPEVLSQ